jgi:hypothetical protein
VIRTLEHLVQPYPYRQSAQIKSSSKGPRSRFEEFITRKVMRDFLRGFRVLHIVGPCVTGLRLDPVSSEMI